MTEPTRVLETELSAAPRDVDVPDHAVAKVLIRLHGIPLGFANVRVTDGRVTHQAVLAAAELLGLADHLAEDGISDPAEPGTGWACQSPGPYPLPATVSVVLCTRDRPEQLRQALDSVLTAAGPDVDVVVVDNAPRTDGTKSVVRDLADDRVRYVVEPRPGLSVARNTGARAARGDVIAFTDDDVLVDAGWVEALRRGFTRAPRVGCVTGLVPSAELETAPQHFFDEKVHWSSSTTPRLYDLVDNREPSTLYPYAAGKIGTGANFAIARAAYEALGDFDVALGAGSATRGGEDLDWFVRTLLQGWSIAYEPAAVVWHWHRRELDALADQLFGYGSGLTAYLTKHLLTVKGFPHIARSAARGLRYSNRQRATSLDAGIDPDLLQRERAGMVWGPLLYVRARRAARAQALR